MQKAFPKSIFAVRRFGEVRHIFHRDAGAYKTQSADVVDNSLGCGGGCGGKQFVASLYFGFATHFSDQYLKKLTHSFRRSPRSSAVTRVEIDDIRHLINQDVNEEKVTHCNNLKLRASAAESVRFLKVKTTKDDEASVCFEVLSSKENGKRTFYNFMIFQSIFFSETRLQSAQRLNRNTSYCDNAVAQYT
jgi:hypothetical protein